jgi:hypothetical protein
MDTIGVYPCASCSARAGKPHTGACAGSGSDGVRSVVAAHTDTCASRRPDDGIAGLDTTGVDIVVGPATP